MGRNSVAFVMTVAGTFLNLLMSASMAINPGCDFYQQLEVGQIYYVHNLQYPGKYPASTSCRWIGDSPQNTQIVISCEDIDLPTSPNCNLDKLSISLTGNPNLNDARNYCGKGAITLYTQANKMAIGLFTMPNSPGGRFICTVTATQTGSPPTSTPGPQVCDCGKKGGTRIVGGHETGVNEYPLMAALLDSVSKELFCGAALIAEYYAISAAHCLYKYEAITLGLLLGDHNIEDGAEAPNAKLYRVSNYILHPNFNSDTLLNDIGVIRTNTRIQFNLQVNPVCLPFRYTNNLFVNNKVTALGWGTTEFTGPKSDVLQEVDLDVIPNSDCRALIRDRPITANQLCTYTPGKDTCQSDSGGPLLWFDPDSRRLQLVGIVSYGLGCASSKPGTSTRITSYLSWILSTTQDAVYCIK